jgi:hypothetical protein
MIIDTENFWQTADPFSLTFLKPSVLRRLAIQAYSASDEALP